MSMDVAGVMERERGLIEEQLKGFFDQEIKRMSKDPLFLNLLKQLEEYTLRGGKRIRSILTVMGYRSVGGQDVESARKASIALELIQTMLLIHDDVMDRSHSRRGGPSFHIANRDLHKDLDYKGDPELFGQNMAIIAGDLAESYGERALLSSGFPPENMIRSLEAQTEMIRDTGLGQLLDLYSVELDEWSEEMVLKLHEYKTARYTIEGPLTIGALLHGVSEEQLEVLSSFAIPVGISFQLVDDLIGLRGDPKRGGIHDLSDIKEGKRTLLIVKALEFASDSEREKIFAALGNKCLTVELAEEVRDIIKNCGSEEYSRNMAKELAQKGAAALEDQLLDDEVVEFLKGLAGMILSRAPRK